MGPTSVQIPRLRIESLSMVTVVTRDDRPGVRHNDRRHEGGTMTGATKDDGPPVVDLLKLL